jgi:hypothetical protein
VTLYLKDGLIWNTGYVRITDLGIARVWRPDNSSDTSGTPGYMGKFLVENLK